MLKTLARWDQVPVEVRIASWKRKHRRAGPDPSTRPNEAAPAITASTAAQRVRFSAFPRAEYPKISQITDSCWPARRKQHA
jgi:hypothetical protein